MDNFKNRKVMTIVALANQANKIRDILKKDTAVKWCYIGKDVAKRKRISRTLSEGRRFYLKDRLYKIAEELRQPYLDFVAELGKRQSNQLNWWGSKFASKSPFQTDSFLLFCYRILIDELIQERGEDAEKLVIFIEDIWLYVDITKNMDKREGVEFLGDPSLLLKKAYLLIRGIFHRLLLVPWFVISYAVAYYHHRYTAPDVLKTNKPAICILNPAEKRTFKNGRHIDNYMPGLSGLYKKNRVPFFYLYPFPFPLSTSKYLANNKATLWPLVFDIKFSSLMKRLLAYWNPNLEKCTSVNIYHRDTSFLLERERWLEFSRAGFNLHLTLFDALTHFLDRRWCSHIIYSFENQPWEKILCMAAHKNNVATIGYQHSSIWRLYLIHFIGKGEDSFVPLPHKIVTTGNYSAELYKENGIPSHKVVVGGTWRHSYLLDFEENDYNKSRNSKPTVLIGLSIDIKISTSMLENIFEIVSEQLNNDVEFWVKPHPGTPVSNLQVLKGMPSGFRITDSPFQQLLKYADIVISTSSTAGLEAFLCGKKVICYIPENFLAADPLLEVENERIYKWYEGEKLDTNFIKGPPLSSNKDELKAIRKRYFDNVNSDIWLKFISV